MLQDATERVDKQQARRCRQGLGTAQVAPEGGRSRTSQNGSTQFAGLRTPAVFFGTPSFKLQNWKGLQLLGERHSAGVGVVSPGSGGREGAKSRSFILALKEQMAEKLKACRIMGNRELVE